MRVTIDEPGNHEAPRRRREFVDSRTLAGKSDRGPAKMIRPSSQASAASAIEPRPSHGSRMRMLVRTCGIPSFYGTFAATRVFEGSATLFANAATGLPRRRHSKKASDVGSGTGVPITVNGNSCATSGKVGGLPISTTSPQVVGSNCCRAFAPTGPRVVPSAKVTNGENAVVPTIGARLPIQPVCAGRQDRVDAQSSRPGWVEWCPV